MSSHYDNDDAVATMMRRVTVRSVDDTGTQQIVTYDGLAGEKGHKAYRQQAHGSSSVPPVGSEGWILTLGGRSDRPLFLDGEHKDHRPKGYEPGDNVLYDAHGQAISLVKQNIRIVGAGTVLIKGPKIVLEGEVHLGGDGGQLVHRKGDKDSDGDVAQESASKVYAV